MQNVPLVYYAGYLQTVLNAVITLKVSTWISANLLKNVISLRPFFSSWTLKQTCRFVLRDKHSEWRHSEFLNQLNFNTRMLCMLGVQISLYISFFMAIILIYYLSMFYVTSEFTFLSKVGEYLSLFNNESISLRKTASFWVWSSSRQFINTISLTVLLKMKFYMIYEDWEFRQKALRGLFQNKKKNASWKKIQLSKGPSNQCHRSH